MRSETWQEAEERKKAELEGLLLKVAELQDGQEIPIATGTKQVKGGIPSAIAATPEELARGLRPTPIDFHGDMGKAEFTGLSVDYYKLHIAHPIHYLTPYNCECGDIIEALNMDFNEGEAFKAIWRKAAARLNMQKQGQTAQYDAEKIKYFGARILAVEQNQPSTKCRINK